MCSAKGFGRMGNRKLSKLFQCRKQLMGRVRGRGRGMGQGHGHGHGNLRFSDFCFKTDYIEE